MRRYLILSTLGCLLLAAPHPVRAAGEGEEGAQPIYRTNAEIMRDAAQLALRPRPTEVQDREAKRREIERPRLKNPASRPLSRWPLVPLPQLREAGPFLAQTPGLSFTSVTLADVTPLYPPDSMGAVGPTQFLTHVNGRVRVHAKSNGAVGSLDADDEAFWSTVRTQPGTISDPRVRYDRLSDRWFLAMIDVPQSSSVSNRVMIAVSDGATITGATGWHFFYFNQDAASPAGDTGCFADYPTLGIDNNAVYLSASIFCGQDFSNTTAWVLRKSSLLNPSTPANLTLTAGAVKAFRGLLTPYPPKPTLPEGLFTAQGVDSVDPAATTGYFIGVDGALFGRLVLRAVQNPGSGSPTLGPNVFIDVPDTYVPNAWTIGIPGGLQLDALDDRLMNAQLRNGKIWTVHQNLVDANGVASPSGNRAGLRWYAIDVASAAVSQVGTVFDTAGANPKSYWMGSIGVSGQGHAALGSTVASTQITPGAATVGRLASDPAGQTQGPPVVYQAGSGIYSAPLDRWGDYSMTSLDPCDDMSLWTIQEFAQNTNWATRVARLLAPPPAPPFAPQGALKQHLSSVLVSLTGSSWYNPPASGMSSCRTPLGVSVSGGVTVNSVTYVGPTQLVVDLDTSGAGLGLKTVTVTNPDGQSASATVLNVVPALSASKSVSLVSGGTFTAGATIAYTVVLRNDGNVAQADNPGAELTDFLPPEVSLDSATATSGAAVTTPATNTVTWNGPVAANGGTVTITIQATIKATVPGGTAISNQGQLSFDTDANGTNDAASLTDDPGLPGSADPTTFYTAARFYTLAPCRLVDTRGAAGPMGAPPLSPGSRSFTLVGNCGLPADAKALSLNVTVTAPTNAGDLRLYPAGSSLPLVSTVNYAPGQTRANNAIAVLSASGGLAVQCDQAAGTVHLIIDVNGYFK